MLQSVPCVECRDWSAASAHDQLALGARSAACADNVCVVIGDHEVSVECRRSHRADVREGRTRGPDTRLCHQQRPGGPLAARASMDCRGIANARDRSVWVMYGAWDLCLRLNESGEWEPCACELLLGSFLDAETASHCAAACECDRLPAACFVRDR